jgi:lipid-binding SYLF domain-containing protein
MTRYCWTLLLLASLGASGCASPKGATTEERRDFIQYMRKDALSDLYQQVPGAENQVKNAPAYAVFSNVGVSLLLLGGGQGYGVVVDGKTGESTYMKMAQLTAGPGVGLKDFRAVFIFNNRGAVDRFVSRGWQWGGEAEAGFKSGPKGSEVGAVAVSGDLTVYQFTKAGVQLRAMVPLTKYWQYYDLN